MADLRVALISHEFPPYLIGGIGTHCYDLALSLSKKGIDTTVFSGKSKQLKIEKLNSNLKVVRLPFSAFPPRFVWFQLQNFKTLLGSFLNFDLIHGVSPISSAVFACFKENMGKPFVATIHGTALTDLKTFINSPFSEWTRGDFSTHVIAYPLTELSIKKCIRSADHIVVCGHSTLKELQSTYNNIDLNKFSVIYNGISLNRFNRIGHLSGKEKHSITYFGRLVYRKGILHLVRAIAILESDFPDIELKIIGTGPLKSKIESLVEELNLRKNVHLYGYLPSNRLLEEIERTRIVALPSLYEVGPFISALEAMACKRPLVAFESNFTHEFVSHAKTGLLAKFGDIRDLSEKIRLLLSDENLCRNLGCNAYEYVKENHDWTKLVDRYIDLYQRCVLD